MYNPVQTNIYLENSVNTASPAKLLIMLCDGAVKHCRQGIEAIKQKDYEKANHHLCRVQDIINEFIVTLDNQSEIAASLLPLYDYLLRRLRDANVQKNEEIALEVLQFLQELKDTWVEADKKLKQGVQEGQQMSKQVSQYG